MKNYKNIYFISLLRFLPRRVPDRIDSSSVNPRSDFSTSESRDTVRGSVRGALTIPPPGGLPPPADRANILPCCVLVPGLFDKKYLWFLMRMIFVRHANVILKFRKVKIRKKIRKFLLFEIFLFLPAPNYHFCHLTP